MKNLKTNIYLISLTAILFADCCSRPTTNYTVVDSVPEIFPDYKDVSIPVNIAPLNFRLTDHAKKLHVVIQGKSGLLSIKGINKINIPIRKWRKLLRNNANDSLSISVYAHNNNKWNKYLPFYIHVNSEPADPWLVYRLISPGYEAWSEMGLYQRNITSFREYPIIDSRLLPGNCMNCHSFNQNNPDQMLFHLRGKIGGTMLFRDNQFQKIDTKTKETNYNCVYPFWHPSGDYIAFSVNNIYQVFHSIGEKRIEVYDAESDIVVFDIKNYKLISSKLIFSKEIFETFPSFTPDGRSLIFCSAPAKEMPDAYNNIRYDLCRISFDSSSGNFGKYVDTLFNASSIGKSASFPRVSPDGRFLMFTLSDYGNFPIWHKDADLFNIDLKTGVSTTIKIANSEEAESYHSWSSGANWFVFSSRRQNGLYTQPFIAYIDKNGKAGKPFLLPQKDPDFYDNCMRSFNIPEFVERKVESNREEMVKAIESSGKTLTFELKD